MDLNTLISSAVGALIGSALTLLATYKAHKWQAAELREKDERIIKAVLQAIHDEVETLWDNYMDTAGSHIEALPDNQPLNMYWPLTQDYFTVYNMNAFQIGRIEDPDLRKLIVSTYTKARALIDSYRMNNDIVQKHEYAYWIWQETKSQVHGERATALLHNLVQYASGLKKRHADIKAQVQLLLRELRKEGVLNKR
jgi:hypothetical protein